MLGILGAFSQYEREIIVERTKAGLRRARSQGKRGVGLLSII
jgi:DNA invertase Pin-like site-specific DNA recombinase